MMQFSFRGRYKKNRYKIVTSAQNIMDNLGILSVHSSPNPPLFVRTIFAAPGLSKICDSCSVDDSESFIAHDSVGSSVVKLYN
jgi:hypothetical protein